MSPDQLVLAGLFRGKCLPCILASVSEECSRKFKLANAKKLHVRVLADKNVYIKDWRCSPVTMLIWCARSIELKTKGLCND